MREEVDEMYEHGAPDSGRIAEAGRYHTGSHWKRFGCIPVIPAPYAHRVQLVRI